MEVWQVWGVIGIVLIIVEMFTPALFFLNLALAAIITGAASYYANLDLTAQVIVFAASSVVLLVFLRPLLLNAQQKPDETGVEAKYFGQSAKVTEKITKESGRIAIFGEVWDARNVSDEEIEGNESVKIVGRDGLTMIVEKI